MRLEVDVNHADRANETFTVEVRPNCKPDYEALGRKIYMAFYVYNPVGLTITESFDRQGGHHEKG